MLLVEEMTNIINHIEAELPDGCLCRNTCNGDCDTTFVITSFFPMDFGKVIIRTKDVAIAAGALTMFDHGYEITGCEEGYGGVGTIMDIEVGPEI